MHMTEKSSQTNRWNLLPLFDRLRSKRLEDDYEEEAHSMKEELMSPLTQERGLKSICWRCRIFSRERHVGWKQ